MLGLHLLMSMKIALVSLDNSPEWSAWVHAIDWLEAKGEVFDCFLSLPATAPLRSKVDVVNCINLLDENTDIVVTISETSRAPISIWLVKSKII